MITGKSSLEKKFFLKSVFPGTGAVSRQDFSPVRTWEPFASSKGQTCTAIDFFLAEGMEKVKK